MKNFTKLLLIWVVFFLALPGATKATHLMGGNLNYEYLGLNIVTGNYDYRVTITIYRYCASGSSLLPTSLDIGVYQDNVSNPTGDKLLVIDGVVGLISQQSITPPNGNDSCTFAPNVCVEQGVYQTVLSIPVNTTGYYFISDLCCRNNNILNVFDPGNTGQSYFAYAPPPAIVNSSPVFATLPVPFICANDTASILNQAFDPDGDLLSYHFVEPYAGLSGPGNPAPNPPPVYAWPIPLIGYNPTYSVTDPFGPGGSAVIDTSTGLASYYAPAQGFYVLAVEITEYRNGVVVGITRLDLQIIVIACPVNPPPTLSSSSSQVNFTIEEGDTLCFSTTFLDANGDSLFMTHTGDIFDSGITNPAATFVDSTGAGTVTGSFCWVTSCDQGRTTPYQFSVIVTDNGCPAKITNIVYTITVLNTTAPVSITGPDTLCLNASSGITYSIPGVGGYTHGWTVSNGTISGSTTGSSVNVSFPSAGTATLSAVNVNSNGCISDTVTKDVFISPLPIASAGPDVSFCSGGSASLGATGVGGVSYVWTPATGLSSSTISNPVVTISNAGTTPIVVTYVLTSTLTGCVATDTVVVTSNPLAVAAAGPDTALCTGNSVVIGGPTIPGSVYTWTPATGLSSTTVSDPTVTLLTAPDTVQYVLQVQNSFGCDGMDTVVITVAESPVANAGTNKVFCGGASVNIGGNPVAGYSYSWSPVTGLSNPTISQPSLTLNNTSGQLDTLYYIVTATLGNCTDTDTVRVVVRPNPISNAGPDILLCSGDSVQIGTGVTPGYIYSWDPAGGLNATNISDPVVTLTNVGTTPDTLLYIVTTTLNGCITTDSVTIINSPVPVANAGADIAFCSGTPATIGSAALPGYLYAWNPSTGLSSSTAADPTVTQINTSGVNDTVNFILTTNLFGCLDADTVQVIIQPSPISDAGPNQQLICAGGAVQLGTANTPGYTYSWSPATGLNNSSISDPTLTLNNTGSAPDTLYYVVTTTLNGCVTTDTVQVISSPVPVANAGADVTICSGDTTGLGSLAIPGYSYSWLPSTGLSNDTISDPFATLTNGTLVIDTVSYIVSTNLFGCLDSDTVLVFVKPLPISQAGPDVVLCGGDTLILGTAATPGYSYSWTPAAGLSSTTISDPVVIVANTGTTPSSLTYTVVTTWDGCISSDSITITVNPQPVVAATATPPSICLGASSVLDATGAATYNWEIVTNPGVSIGTTNPLTVTPAVTTTYLLVGSNSFACSGQNTVTVVVNPLPVVQINAANDTICDGDTLTLDATGASTYSWSVSGGGTIGTGTPIQVSPTAPTTYVVTGTDVNGCENTDSITVSVNPAATITGIYGTASVCPGVTGVYYWVTNPNPSSTYQWVVTNGTIITGQGNDTITVDWSAISGPAMVTVVEVTDLGCQSDPIQFPININVFLTPVAPVGPLTFCANAAQGIYTALNTNGSNYNWFAQGGVIVSGNGTNTVTVNWTAQGPQTVYLWYEETSMTSVDTCFGGSDTLAVNIDPAPVTSAITGPVSICIDGTGAFSVVNTATSTYQWFINGGTILSGNGTNAITASWLGTGTATVSVVETNSLGCLGDTVTFTITVNDLPAADAGADVSVCQGLGVQLNASGGITYSWSPTTGLSNPAIANPIAAPSTNTTYIVLVTDANGCSNTDTVEVSVNSLPIVTVSANTAICIGGSTQLNASGGASFFWSPAGSLNNAAIPDPVASPQVTTIYTVVVTNGIGCADSSQVTVTVNPLPVATTSSDTTICEGTSASLSAGGGVSFSWTPSTGLNNTGISNPVATPQSPITYTVTVTDANGCTDDEDVSISLNIMPQAAFTVGEDVSDISCEGYTTTLVNQSVDATAYEWYFTDGSTSTDENPQHQFVFDGSNQVILVAINNMCQDTATQEISHTSLTVILKNTPKVFSPNGDGANDCFKLATDFADCSEWSVYNRWGNRVFENSGSSPCWNGKKDNNGEELPTGTYYLVVKVFDGQYNGTVTLIR